MEAPSPNFKIEIPNSQFQWSYRKWRQIDLLRKVSKSSFPKEFRGIAVSLNRRFNLYSSVYRANVIRSRHFGCFFRKRTHPFWNRYHFNKTRKGRQRDSPWHRYIQGSVLEVRTVDASPAIKGVIVWWAYWFSPPFTDRALTALVRNCWKLHFTKYCAGNSQFWRNQRGHRGEKDNWVVKRSLRGFRLGLVWSRPAQQQSSTMAKPTDGKAAIEIQRKIALTLAPIWFPHWPAWMCTISLILT